MRYVFEIPGIPVAKGRPRTRAFVDSGGEARAQIYTPKKTAGFEAKVAMAACRADLTPLEGPVRLRVWAIFPMKGQPLKRDARPRVWKPTRPDGKNLLASVEDGLNGIAYADDSQIVDTRAIKIHGAQGERARTIVMVEQITAGAGALAIPALPAAAQSENRSPTG